MFLSVFGYKVMILGSIFGMVCLVEFIEILIL